MKESGAGVKLEGSTWAVAGRVGQGRGRWAKDAPSGPNAQGLWGWVECGGLGSTVLREACGTQQLDQGPAHSSVISQEMQKPDEYAEDCMFPRGPEMCGWVKAISWQPAMLLLSPIFFL